jgi:hypothetical protein
MDLPATPALRSLESISPSFYNAAIICRARAAWQQFGDRYSLPSSTGAMLGSCFHAVMAMGNKGQLSSNQEGLDLAKKAFDDEAQRLFTRAHPLVKAKFAAPEKLPFYTLRRSRAAALGMKASGVARFRAPRSGPKTITDETPFVASRLVERKFASRDAKVSGKVDLLEPRSEKITDYKSGEAPKDNPRGMSEAELRQLRLYAYLAQENGHRVSKMSIVRSDGFEADAAITSESATAEGESAKNTLNEFNESVALGHSFRDLATPSEACANCPCIPFCERFWEVAQEDWEENCGTNVEGVVTATQDADLPGVKLKTLTLDCKRGSAPRGTLVAQQIPLDWLSLGSQVPSVGCTVRIVTAARSKSEPGNPVLRVDRIKSTTVWRLP